LVLAETDLVVTCTGAVGAVVAADVVSAALGRRSGDAPLLFCDLGLPRDTAPDVADLPGVSVVDLESLQRRLTERRGGSESERAAEIVAEEMRSYLASQRSAEVTPTVTALRKRAAEVVDSELLRLDSRLPELDGPVRDELARTVRRVVDKLLHTPTVRVKQLASEPGGTGYADALRELFELDPQTAALIGTPVSADDMQLPGRGASASVSQAQASQAATVSHASAELRDRPVQDGEDR
jgi:glutamyl-tRNA reductase